MKNEEIRKMLTILFIPVAGTIGSLVIGFFKYEVFNNPPPSSPKKESMFNEDIKLDIKFDFEQYTK
jgi:hypothetical protein